MATYCTDDPCTACGALTEGGNDLHHVKTRGAGGPDHPWNLMPLCHLHHVELHNSGLVTFSKKFKNVHTWLVLKDWAICELTGKWYHSKEANDDHRQAANEDTSGSEI